ncbi:MAG TPA: response regulator transcription factor [Methylomirabilota bacterium]|jgi:DNA-binding response OmpR family regulator
MAVVRANNASALPARHAAAIATAYPRHAAGHPPRILVVAKDPVTTERIAGVLRGAAFEVVTGTATPVRDVMLDGRSHDLIVMDTDLPGAQGFAVLETLRKWDVQTPVLLVTPEHDVAGTIRGLDLGADDVAAKTCGADELRARVGALLRRVAAPPPHQLHAGDLRFDPESRQVTRGSRAVTLTGREARLLEYLMRNEGRVVTKTMVLDHVWGLGFEGESNLVEVYMSYLRRKIDGGHKSRLLHTIRNIGYMLSAED